MDDSNKPGMSKVKKRLFENVTTYADDSQDAASEIAQIRTMLEKNKENLDLREWLAFKLYSDGQYDEAIELYEDLVRRGHRIVNQHFYLANAYYKKGRIRDACNSWRIVAETAPNDVKGQKAAARLEKALVELKTS